jgi:hypothetical protein
MLPWFLLSACTHEPALAPPLAPRALQASDLDTLRASFNAARGQPRVLVWLSAG